MHHRRLNNFMRNFRIEEEADNYKTVNAWAHDMNAWMKERMGFPIWIKYKYPESNNSQNSKIPKWNYWVTLIQYSNGSLQIPNGLACLTDAHPKIQDQIDGLRDISTDKQLMDVFRNEMEFLESFEVGMLEFYTMIRKLHGDVGDCLELMTDANQQRLERRRND